MSGDKHVNHKYIVKDSAMMVSHHTVVIIAAAVWYIGGFVLLLKGSSLLKQAYMIDPDSIWSIMSPVIGVTAGLLKAKFIFLKNCAKNINRIRALTSPRVWQCYRPGMLVFLAFIIPTGMWLSNAATGKYLYLCLVGALDLSICVSLFTSSIMFWKLRAFSETFP
jgi:hypothetical protein